MLICLSFTCLLFSRVKRRIASRHSSRPNSSKSVGADSAISPGESTGRCGSPPLRELLAFGECSHAPWPLVLNASKKPLRLSPKPRPETASPLPRSATARAVLLVPDISWTPCFGDAAAAIALPLVVVSTIFTVADNMCAPSFLKPFFIKH